MSGSTGIVPYDPSNALQSTFLNTIAQGESGGGSHPMLGYGGANLAGDPTDSYGFPQWAGVVTGTGPTQAAGTYQFEPETWDNIASQYGLNFGSETDQSAGAWYLAQSAFSANTNGGSLTDALQNGDFSTIQTALSGTWPSLGGSGGLPGGLASALGSALGSGSGNSGSGSSSGTGIIGTIENWAERFGLVVVGVVVIAIALWYLLAHTETGKAAIATVAAS